MINIPQVTVLNKAKHHGTQQFVPHKQFVTVITAERQPGYGSVASQVVLLLRVQRFRLRYCGNLRQPPTAFQINLNFYTNQVKGL